MKHVCVILEAALSLAAAVVGLAPAYAQTDSVGSRYAVTGFSVNFLREKPDFPEELGTQALMGTPVEIVAQEGYWRQVVTPEPYTAWCVDMGLVEMSGREMEEYIAAPKYIVTAGYSHVFAGPSVSSGRISDLVAGDLLRTVPESGRRAARQSAHGSAENKGVSKKGFAKVMLPSGAEGYVLESDIADFRDWACSRKATGANIVRTAKLFLGIPYMWGGTSIKGVDCSGFTRMVWFMNGVLLPRNASAQSKTGVHVPYPGKGTDSVDPDVMHGFCKELGKGDLLFFGTLDKVSHVGIYIGGGLFIHASGCVRINSLIPGHKDYYGQSWKLLHACKVIGQEDLGTGVSSMLLSPYYFPQK